MESLVQAFVDSQPASYSSKATQTDAPQTTTGYISKATQTDKVQPPREYGSESTQTDTLDAPTPKECCNKVEDPPAQLPMVQQSPRRSRTDQTNVTQTVPIQPVSESIRGLPKFRQETSPRLLELFSKRTSPDGSFTPGQVQTGHSDGQDSPALDRLRQTEPDLNIGNATISLKSTIDEAMERYHSVIR